MKRFSVVGKTSALTRSAKYNNVKKEKKANTRFLAAFSYKEKNTIGSIGHLEIKVLTWSLKYNNLTARKKTNKQTNTIPHCVCAYIEMYIIDVHAHSKKSFGEANESQRGFKPTCAFLRFLVLGREYQMFQRTRKD